MSTARRCLPLALLLLTLSFPACSDGTDPPVATTVSISGGTTSFSALGQTAQFTARVLDQKGKVMEEAPISWSSSASTVVEVSLSGMATARSNGTADVIASSGSASGSRSLTVAQLPGSLAKVSGDQQTGTAGMELSDDLTVRVLDGGGAPIAGAQVTFSVSSGGGSVSGSPATTSSGGEASVGWTLGTVAGADQEVTATAGSVSATFTATAEPGPPASVSVRGGNGQTGFAVEDLPLPLQVLVADQFGNPTPEITVSWASASGGAVTAAGPRTDEDGQAEATWTLGSQEGANSATATVEELSPATFTATALRNAAIAGTVSATGGFLSPGADPGMGAARDRRLPARAPAPSSSAAPERVPGELLVLFREGVLDAPALGSGMYRNPEVARAVSRSMAAALGANPLAGSFTVAGLSPAALSARIRVSESELETVARALRRDPRVRAVEPNYLLSRPRPPEGDPLAGPARAVIPNEFFYPLQAWHYEMVRLPYAWEITTGSADVTVAVVDDGIRFDHWDLTANLTGDGYDFVEDIPVPLCAGGTVGFAADGDGPDPDPTMPAAYIYDDTQLCVTAASRYDNHGGHVAGTIGAVAGNGGGVGVNWNVSIRPVRVLGTIGSGSTWAINQGILYAAGLPASDGSAEGTVQPSYGAQIINMSLGGDNYSETQAAAVTAAFEAGALIIAAAGNDGVSDLHYPAAYPEAMAVSSVDPWWSLSGFSNWGDWVDIAAPGGSGTGDFTADVLSSRWDFQLNSPVWSFVPGTSMATPHVAGVAALVLAANPGMTPSQLRQNLLDYAYPAGPSNLYGAGIVDAFASLTGGMGFERDLWVRLVNAGDGTVVSTVQAGSDGSFRFSRLDDGDYMVFAGYDERGDQSIGVPGRLWGSFGGTSVPSVVTVNGSGLHSADFDLGYPIEQENNGSSALADYLSVGGYMNGDLGTITDEDWYRVQIPTAGTYTFSTSGWIGACGLAAQANTMLELYNNLGGFLSTHDDQDAASYQYCARITTYLTPGTYYLRVRGSASGGLRGIDQAAGYYRVRVEGG